jgi:hypothetical protein
MVTRVSAAIVFAGGILFSLIVPAQAQEVPPLADTQVDGITISALSSSGAMIRWTSNQEREFWLMYSTQADFTPPASVVLAERVSPDGIFPADYAATPHQLSAATLYYFRVFTYAPDDAQHPRYFQSPYAYLQKFVTESSPRDLTPRINYWHGKVNQYIDPQGNWQTDPDGSSGANIDKLAYCKKWYPHTGSVEAYRYETILDWKAAGNTGSYAGTHESTRCVPQPVELKPDLVVEDVTYHEHWQVWDDVLIARVCNRGEAPTPAVQVHTQFTLQGVSHTHGNGESLAVGQCQDAFSLVNGFMQDWQTAPYTVKVEADTDGAAGGRNNVVDESNEGNNAYTESVLIGNAGALPTAHLTMPQGGETWQKEQTYRIEWEQKNVDMITLGYSSCPSCLDWIVYNQPVAFTATGGAFDWSVPSHIPAGSNYKIKLIAYHTGIGSVMVESGTFSVVAPLPPAPLPDLVIENFSFTPLQGQQWDAQLEFDMVNSGQGSAPDHVFTLLVHNDHNGIILKSETYSGMYFTPGHRAHVYVMGKIGQGLESGANPFVISVDHNQDIAESNEANNVYHQTFQLPAPTVAPDFIVTNIAIKRDPSDHNRPYIYATVKNTGGRPLPAGQILSVRVRDLDTGDVYTSGITDDYVAGYEKELVMGTRLKSKPSDVYRLEALVDNVNLFIEQNEGNNLRMETILRNGREPQYVLDDATIRHHVARLRELRSRRMTEAERAEMRELRRQLEDAFQFFDDADNDNLPDYLEPVIGTDPHNRDTDGDGHKDGTEVFNGYNPLGA